MDIKPIPLPGNTQTAPAQTADAGPIPNRAETEHRVVPAERTQEARTDAPREPRPLPTPAVRIELHIDRDTNEVFGRVVNRNTGEPVREVPAEELRNLQAHVKEFMRSLVDELA